MSEPTEQHGIQVTLEEYMASLPWRASTDDVTEAVNASNEESSRPHFILRLLDSDRAGATDRIVEIAANDDLGPSDKRARFLVSVRPFINGNAKGRIESHTFSDDGLVCGKNVFEDTGYLLGTDGIDEDDLRNVARVPLKVPEKVELKYLKAESPSPEEQYRYYG